MVASGPVGGSTDDGDPLALLLQWAAEDRVDLARRRRVRQASLGRQAGERATWRALLVDLAEGAEEVVVTSRAGVVRGTIAAVGEDFCAVRRAGSTMLMPLAAMGQVETAGELPVGFRGVAVAATWVELLAELAADRPVVRIHTAVGPVRTGQLIRAGADTLTIRTDHPASLPISFNLAVVDAVALG
ncbi:MAG: hypothetical protein ACR2QE_12730 [Acidimicrobiales bacterium]